MLCVPALAGSCKEGATNRARVRERGGGIARRGSCLRVARCARQRPALRWRPLHAAGSHLACPHGCCTLLHGHRPHRHRHDPPATTPSPRVTPPSSLPASLPPPPHPPHSPPPPPGLATADDESASSVDVADPCFLGPTEVAALVTTAALAITLHLADRRIMGRSSPLALPSSRTAHLCTWGASPPPFDSLG